MRMEVFADTANLKEIETWLDHGVIDGVTTNPSIMLQNGVYNLRAGAEKIASLIHPLPLSVEVVTDDADAMLDQARQMARWAPNIVIKIPVINTQGAPSLGVIRRLTAEGVHVNATACLSFGQAMLAAKAGAVYVSLFAGRMSDEGIDAPGVISSFAEWLRAWDFPTKIIVGSIREAINVQDAALAGAHVITVPPKFLAQLVDHKYSRFTVQQFLQDGLTAAETMLARELEIDVKVTPDPVSGKARR
jgi:transaldolase